MEAQIGRETTPKEYISRLTEVFTEVRRVLRPDGTLWLNISDTYAGKGNQGDFVDPKNPNGRNGQAVALNNKVEGCKPKDMIGIPWMLAFALRDTGWYLRNDIIWMKDNPMPESVKDRCAARHTRQTHPLCERATRGKIRLEPTEKGTHARKASQNAHKPREVSALREVARISAAQARCN